MRASSSQQQPQKRQEQRDHRADHPRQHHEIALDSGYRIAFASVLLAARSLSLLGGSRRHLLFVHRPTPSRTSGVRMAS